MSYVISANYRDRSSAFRWLVRKMGESHKNAVARKSVKATGVTFGPSDKYEDGFGCTRVAFAESVEIVDQETKTIEVIFDGKRDFEDKRTGQRLTDKAFASLELTPDGKILGVLVEDSPETEDDAE